MIEMEMILQLLSYKEILNVEIAKRVPLEKIIKEINMPSLNDFNFSKDNDYVEEVCVYF